jgi:hypothetical protein
VLIIFEGAVPLLLAARYHPLSAEVSEFQPNRGSLMLKKMLTTGVVALFAAASVMAGADSNSSSNPKVSPADQVQFQQKTVEAQMQELQERMFHLADLTRDTEPDDSSRLLMAVRKAREDLIIEQMRDCIDQLGKVDLSKAADEQEQILIKLNELKKLLTTTDLDLQMQLDKLKKLNDAIAKLDKGIKEERREQKNTNELATVAQSTPTTNPVAANPNAATPPAMAAPKADQQQNRKATEAVAQTMKDLGGETAKAGDKLGNAAQSMSLAEGHLGNGHPGQASPLQGQAAEKMEEAKADLEKQRQKLLDELEHQVRQQVVTNLQEMLDRQKSIRGATEAVASHLNTADREVQLRVKQLSPAETAIVRICGETLELINTTQFSVALPPALQEIKTNLMSISDRMATGAADLPLVDDQKQVEADLQNLLDTFKQLASVAAGECKGGSCKGDKNKILAELKTLKLLETQVEKHTEKVDAQRAVADGTPEVQKKIAGVRDEQASVHDAVRKLHEELVGG